MQLNEQLIKDNSELKLAARNQLRGNWGIAILLCLIVSIITGISGAVPYAGIIISLLVTGPLTLGLVICFMRLIKNEPFRLENLFDGFKNFTPSLILQLLISLFTFLWALLLIVPGIIASYRYAMAFYILNDNPQMSASEALAISKEMMMGFKWKLFCLHFSFIGWVLLCILTVGVGFLWLYPYVKASEAYFYQNLKDASNPAVNLIE